MLPKIQTTVQTNPAGTTSTNLSKRDNIATTLVLEDHLKSMMSKTANFDYKPWRNKFAPKNPQSPFGNFPCEYLTCSKITSPKMQAIHEDSQAATTINKYNGKNQGTGGKSSYLQIKKPYFTAPKPLAGAFSKRKIIESEFRRFFFFVFNFLAIFFVNFVNFFGKF